jgi:hypothetical protein
MEYRPPSSWKDWRVTLNDAFPNDESMQKQGIIGWLNEKGYHVTVLDWPNIPEDLSAFLSVSCGEDYACEMMFRRYSPYTLVNNQILPKLVNSSCKKIIVCILAQKIYFKPDE